MTSNILTDELIEKIKMQTNQNEGLEPADIFLSKIAEFEATLKDLYYNNKFQAESRKRDILFKTNCERCGKRINIVNGKSTNGEIEFHDFCWDLHCYFCNEMCRDTFLIDRLKRGEEFE